MVHTRRARSDAASKSTAAPSKSGRMEKQRASLQSREAPSSLKRQPLAVRTDVPAAELPSEPAYNNPPGIQQQSAAAEQPLSNGEPGSGSEKACAHKPSAKSGRKRASSSNCAAPSMQHQDAQLSKRSKTALHGASLNHSDGQHKAAASACPQAESAHAVKDEPSHQHELQHRIKPQQQPLQSGAGPHMAGSAEQAPAAMPRPCSAAQPSSMQAGSYQKKSREERRVRRSGKHAALSKDAPSQLPQDLPGPASGEKADEQREHSLHDVSQTDPQFQQLTAGPYAADTTSEQQQPAAVMPAQASALISSPEHQQQPLQKLDKRQQRRNRRSGQHTPMTLQSDAADDAQRPADVGQKSDVQGSKSARHHKKQGKSEVSDAADQHAEVPAPAGLAREKAAAAGHAQISDPASTSRNAVSEGRVKHHNERRRSRGTSSKEPMELPASMLPADVPSKPEALAAAATCTAKPAQTDRLQEVQRSKKRRKTQGSHAADMHPSDAANAILSAGDTNVKPAQQARQQHGAASIASEQEDTDVDITSPPSPLSQRVVNKEADRHILAMMPAAAGQEPASHAVGPGAAQLLPKGHCQQRHTHSLPHDEPEEQLRNKRTQSGSKQKRRAGGKRRSSRQQSDQENACMQASPKKHISGLPQIQPAAESPAALDVLSKRVLGAPAQRGTLQDVTNSPSPLKRDTPKCRGKRTSPEQPASGGKRGASLPLVRQLIPAESPSKQQSPAGHAAHQPTSSAAEEGRADSHLPASQPLLPANAAQQQGQAGHSNAAGGASANAKYKALPDALGCPQGRNVREHQSALLQPDMQHDASGLVAVAASSANAGPACQASAASKPSLPALLVPAVPADPAEDAEAWFNPLDPVKVLSLLSL